jgi:four helix bundle protein
MTHSFAHEQLHVYQAAITFVAWAAELLERVPPSLAVWDQLDRASTSIPLNIAEGNGKFTAPDRCHAFDIARGSGLECAACLDVLFARQKVSPTESVAGKKALHRIVSMLVGLIRNNSPVRLHEDEVEYAAAREDSEPRTSAPSSGEIYFDHERLQVYQRSLRFIEWTARPLEHPSANLSLWNKLDRASTSIPLNLAEGNGRFSSADRVRFFDHARGSVLACAACLDTLVARKALTDMEAVAGKQRLQDIAPLLAGLIRSNARERRGEITI